MADCFSLQVIFRSMERFFFCAQPTQLCSVVRILFGLFLLPYLFVFGLDLYVFFGASGLVPIDVSVQLLDPDAFSVLWWIAPTDGALTLCFLVFWINAVCLLFGLLPRLQAGMILFWLIAFQHRNVLVMDGEDTLARWIALSLVLMPCGDYWSVDAWRKRLKGWSPTVRPCVGLKLLQVEMTLLYVSTALLKLDGVEWINGTAVIYAVQLHDMFGRMPLPEFFLRSVTLLKFATWGVLLVECFIPFGLWFKETRKIAFCVAVVLHLSLDYSMNLFMFQWFMLVGLIAFWPFGRRIVQ